MAAPNLYQVVVIFIGKPMIPLRIYTPEIQHFGTSIRPATAFVNLAEVLLSLSSWDEKQVEALIDQFDKNKDRSQQIQLRVYGQPELEIRIDKDR